jgi:hypothetical protein
MSPSNVASRPLGLGRSRYCTEGRQGVSSFRQVLPLSRPWDHDLPASVEAAHTRRHRRTRRGHQGGGARTLTRRPEGVFDRIAAITCQIHLSHGSPRRRPEYCAGASSAIAPLCGEALVQTIARGVAGALASRTARVVPSPAPGQGQCLAVLSACCRVQGSAGSRHRGRYTGLTALNPNSQEPNSQVRNFAAPSEGTPKGSVWELASLGVAS